MFFFSKNKKQLKAIFNWLSGVVNKDDFILLEEGGKQTAYYFKFPLRRGDKPQKIKKFNENDITFLIKFLPSRLNFSQFGENGWFCIFRSPDLEIYECEKRFQKSQFRPLYRGLNEEEKKIALKIARDSLKAFLEEKKVLQLKDFNLFLPPVFYLKTYLDVSLWVNGRLRGSFPVENETLAEGIIAAALGAAQDSRFKPLGFHELRDARIEITLISDLKIPLSENLINKNKILPHKGYRLIFGDKAGLFLPEVFNVVRFRDLKEFLNRLASEKAGLPSDIWKNQKARIEIFDVEDFIDDEGHVGTINLFGPIAVSESGVEKLAERMRLAADWLLNIQEADGNFPPIIDPLTGWRAQIDWPRSAFTGWALVEIAALTKEEKYIKAGQKHFQYIKEHLDIKGRAGKGLFEPNNPLLTYAYAGQEALALFKITRDESYYLAARNFAEKISNNFAGLNFEPIAYQQAASFLAELSLLERDFLKPAMEFAKIAKENFENDLKNKTLLNLAVQAELINAFNKIFELTKDNCHKEFSLEVASWIISQQLSQGPNEIFGPFPESTGSDFVYTRGTAKIFETLSILPEFRKEAEKALVWLMSMQYTKENTFFVPAEIRPKVIGGFRHDYLNQEAWIDGAGHFLLGGVRFLRL